MWNAELLYLIFDNPVNGTNDWPLKSCYTSTVQSNVPTFMQSQPLDSQCHIYAYTEHFLKM